MITVNAGPDQFISLNGLNHSVFHLSGTASDSTYSIVGYSWEVIQRDLDAGNVGWTEIGTLNGLNWVAAEPANWNLQNISVRVKQYSGTYTLRLTVTNSNNDTATDDVTIRLQPFTTNSTYSTVSMFDNHSKLRYNVYPNLSNGQPPYYSQFTTIKFTTTASEIGIQQQGGAGYRLAYRINNIDIGKIEFYTDSVSDCLLNLGDNGVNKEVELITNSFGGQYTQSLASYTTAFILKTGDTINLINDPAPTGGILMYGDSVLGTVIDQLNMGFYAMPILLRKNYNQNVTVDGYGGRALRGSVIDEPTRTATLNRWIAKNPTIFYFEIGSNDWGYLSHNTAWRTSDYIAAATSILEDFHAGVPSCQIYWQSPAFRKDLTVQPETGEAMTYFRSEIQNACSTRPWITYVDGLSMISNNRFDIDEVHPDTQGHQEYATNIASVLGLAITPPVELINLGTTLINGIKLGTQKVTKLYKGTTLIWNDPGQVAGASTFNFTKTLKPKMRNNDVFELQKKLVSLGYSIKNPNGYFGVQTISAVKAFQTKHKLKTDGIVGERTRKKLIML